jgi:hypothetical protein
MTASFTPAPRDTCSAYSVPTDRSVLAVLASIITLSAAACGIFLMSEGFRRADNMGDGPNKMSFRVVGVATSGSSIPFSQSAMVQSSVPDPPGMLIEPAGYVPRKNIYIESNIDDLTNYVGVESKYQSYDQNSVASDPGSFDRHPAPGLVALRGLGNKTFRSIPYFDVDIACGKGKANYVKHECVVREQRSFDALISQWDKISYQVKSFCAAWARNNMSGQTYKYVNLEKCIRAESSKEAMRRKFSEPPPKFNDRGIFNDRAIYETRRDDFKAVP